MLIVLYPADVALATEAGTRRYSRRLGSAHRWGDPDDHSVELEVEHVGAEIAVARALNREWADGDRPDPEGDVGDGVQVRHTRYPTGRLLLYSEDRDDHWYFLVTGTFPVFQVVGFLRGDAAKSVAKTIELKSGRPALAVKQSDLRRMKAERTYPPVAA